MKDRVQENGHLPAADSAEHIDTELRLAIIGAGEWVQKYHLPVIRQLSQREHVEIVGIWNRTSSKAEKLASEFGISKIYRDLQEIVNDQDINCISVAVNRQIVGNVLRTLAVRKLPVLCEKPPGRDGNEARELADLITTSNVVAFNRRYMPLNQRFKEMAGEQEQIQFADCSFYRRGRDVPDFVNETGVHGINLLEYLCGNIVKVTTERWSIPGSNTFNIVAKLQFAGGARGQIRFFPLSGVNLEKIEVTGKGFTASINSAHPLTDTREGIITLTRQEASGDPSVTREKQKDQSPLSAGGFEGEYLDFFRSIRDGSETLSNFQNAWRSVMIAEAVQNGLSLEMAET